MTQIYTKLLSFLDQNFTDIPLQGGFQSIIQPTLVANDTLKLSSSHFNKIKDFITSFETLKTNPRYLALIQPAKADHSFTSTFEPHYPSLYTSYDFHISNQDEIKLIEINTNAAMAPLFYSLDKIQQINAFENFETTLKKYISDMSLSKNKRIFIVDHTPKDQAMYYEFLMHAHWFRSWGYETEILDTAEFNKRLAETATRYDGSVVYNRDTDFLLDSDRTTHIKEAYLNRQISLSPHPREYFLIADKSRLSIVREHIDDLILSGQTASMKAIIPESFSVEWFTAQKSAEELWSIRKKYFFKPQNSYGSKAVYNGKSVSRKTFEYVLSEPFIAQEYCPPGEVMLTTSNEVQPFKFDVRFYVIDGQILAWGARCYQGQTTNFRTLGGGAAPIQFI